MPSEQVSPNQATISFEVPKRLIAQEPLTNRADARLMLVDRAAQSIDHYHVRDLPQILQSNDRLVLNNTKVIPATLQGIRSDTGGKWQGLFLEANDNGDWIVICKTRGHLQEGEAVTLLDREMRPAAKLWMLEKLTEGQWRTHPEGQATADELLQQVGRVPLPHYIRSGRMVDADVETYQTVFARNPGAVAAPTAGLHFTKKLLANIDQQGIKLSAVTLHVGLGTFRPIQAKSLDGHKMHREWCELSDTAAAEINATRKEGGRVVAVGTTVVRTLEAAAQSVDDWSSEAKLQSWADSTELFIRPPYDFRVVDSLMTNFHFPSTTLLVLVQTLAGRELVQEAYNTAIREEYRFFSYGDAMLIV